MADRCLMKIKNYFLILLIIVSSLKTVDVWPTSDPNDPYQNVRDDSAIKPIFLRKLANDALSAGDPTFPGYPTNPDESQPKGVYLQTPDTSDITSLFLEVARRIQMRLTK